MKYLIDCKCGNRNNKTLKRMIDRVIELKVAVFCADNWKSYSELVPAELLIQSKSQTQAIPDLIPSFFS